LLKYVGLNPVIVHGGGPQIDQMLKRLAIEPKFRQGVRVTDAATMEIVEMVLGGTINKEIAALITRHGTKAVGLSGKDGGLIQAKPFTKADWTKKLGTDLGSLADHEDYGLVGDVLSINPSLLYTLQGSQVIPVIAPLGMGKDGQTYNINADLVAGAIAGAGRREAGRADRCARHPRRGQQTRVDARPKGRRPHGKERHNQRRHAPESPGLPDGARRRREEGARD